MGSEYPRNCHSTIGSRQDASATKEIKKNAPAAERDVRRGKRVRIPLCCVVSLAAQTWRDWLDRTVVLYEPPLRVIGRKRQSVHGPPRGQGFSNGLDGRLRRARAQ